MNKITIESIARQAVQAVVMMTFIALVLVALGALTA
jgi:hypothetical protein